MPSYMSPVMPRSAASGSTAAPSGQASSTTSGGNGSTNSNSVMAAAANSLKSGPQVLIKNINGKVTITPVPGTGPSTDPSASASSEQMLHKNSSSKQQKNQHTQPQQQPQTSNLQTTQPLQVNGVKKSPPQMRQVLENNTTSASAAANAASSVQKSHSVPNVNGHMQQQQSRDQGVPSRISNLKNNGTGNTAAEHDLHEGKRLLSFNSADGDDPGESDNVLQSKNYMIAR